MVFLDFNGRKKPEFNTLTNSLSGNITSKVEKINMKILKPAVPLIANQKATYNAMIFENGQWLGTDQFPSQVMFEWTLIKTDEFGFPLALKVLGTGNAITFKVPENYQDYRLLLNAISENGNQVQTTMTTLNIPLVLPE